MMRLITRSFCFSLSFIVCLYPSCFGQQEPASMVNVFLGTLAHHDQLSPAANTERSCIHVYHFPGREDGLFIDLSHTLSNGFLTEKHQVDDSTVHGWVESFTTCVAGKDRLYYVLQFDGKMKPTRYY